MSFGSRSTYQPMVRVGNWFEDICLEQDKLRIFKDLRDRGELLVEKTRQLFNNFHKEVNLEASSENVRFGALVQLLPCNAMQICRNSDAQVQAALSVVINEEVVRHNQTINENCELSIAPSVRPCVRNSFRIVCSDEKHRNNELLKYGQHFRLECAETGDDPLLVYSAQKLADLSSLVSTTFSTMKCGELNLKLGLCLKRNCGPGKRIPTAYTNWFCQHEDPRLRFETDGLPVPGNKPLIITHAATNRNLAAENVVAQTLFGPEFLVSVQNYKNVYGRETWKNLWMIGNGQKFT